LYLLDSADGAPLLRATLADRRINQIGAIAGEHEHPLQAVDRLEKPIRFSQRQLKSTVERLQSLWG
jgi:hypothetical protein